MPGWNTVGDLGSQYTDYIAGREGMRPVANTTYNPGYIVQLAAIDKQAFPDIKTVQLPGTGANQSKIMGVVRNNWPGFSASLVGNFTSPVNLYNARGTLQIDVLQWGYHPGVWIDQSGSGAVTLTDGLPVIASRATAGYGQGTTAGTGILGVTVGDAALPSTGMGSSITAAALAQATATATITTPAAGDAPYVTIQIPYIGTQPGVLQTATYQMPALTSTQAGSVTLAAAAFSAYLNTLPAFSQYFIATASVGVVTITVNTLATPFGINFGSGAIETGKFSISLSGMVANSLTFAAGVVGSGGTAVAASGANFAGGTGFLGMLPVWVRAI